MQEPDDLIVWPRVGDARVDLIVCGIGASSDHSKHEPHLTFGALVDNERNLFEPRPRGAEHPSDPSTSNKKGNADLAPRADKGRVERREDGVAERLSWFLAHGPRVLLAELVSVDESSITLFSS